MTIETEHLALIVSGIVALITILTFAFSRLGDHGKREHWQGQVTSTLNNISEDVKDVKTQQRVFERDLMETKGVAMRARAVANAAHVRLDKINAPSAYGTDNEQKEG